MWEVSLCFILTLLYPPLLYPLLYQKIDYGPGYRIYYAFAGKTIVLLLLGGDKASQSKDIARAKEYRRAFKRR